MIDLNKFISCIATSRIVNARIRQATYGLHKNFLIYDYTLASTF